MQERLSIGEMARASRLTVKALRHYAELGLLQPAHVDHKTGYRYYESSQAQQAVTIAWLRALDVPLADIRQALSGELAEVLARHRERLTSAAARTARALEMVDALLATGVPAYDIIPIELEPAPFIVDNVEVRADHVVADVSAGVRKLLRRATRLRLDTSAPVEAEYPVDLTETFRVRLYLPAPADNAEHTLPGGRFLQTIHTGSYHTLPFAYDALLAHARTQGLAAAGPFRERYIDDPDTTPIANLRTFVMLPIPNQGCVE